MMSETSPEQQKPDPWEVREAWTERVRAQEGIVREPKKDGRYLEVELPEGILAVHLRYPGGSLEVRAGDFIEADAEGVGSPRSEALREAITDGKFPYPLRLHRGEEGEEAGR